MTDPHAPSRLATVYVPVGVGLLGAAATIAAAFLGNSGGLVSVLPGNPTTTVTLPAPAPPTVTATVTETVTAAPDTSATPDVSTTPDVPTGQTQVLGTDLQLRDSRGNAWRTSGPGKINGQAFDQVVAMGWCSGCLDSSTTTGYAEFDLENRADGRLKAVIGQSDSSQQSTGRFRFDVQLDGVTKFSKTLPYGVAFPVDIPLEKALRVRFVVTLVGPKVNAVTAFGNPRIETS